MALSERDEEYLYRNIVIRLDLVPSGSGFELVVPDDGKMVHDLYAGHRAIRFIPVWNERALKAHIEHPFHDPSTNQDHPGWMPYARVSDWRVANRLTNAVNAMFAEREPPGELSFDGEPDWSCEYVQHLNDATFEDDLELRWQATITWRNVGSHTIDHKTCSGTIRVHPRPEAGAGVETPEPSFASPGADDEYVVPIVVERTDDAGQVKVWNLTDELDAVPDDTAAIRWVPVRHEHDFFQCGAEHPTTTITGVAFEDDASAEPLLESPAKRAGDGSIACGLKTGTADDPSFLRYGLELNERGHAETTDWDPTIKVKPRKPAQPPGGG